MIDDMKKVRNMAALTHAAYVRAVKNFAAFHRRSPDQLTFEDVRRYQLHLAARWPWPSLLWSPLTAVAAGRSLGLLRAGARRAAPTTGFEATGNCRNAAQRRCTASCGP